MILILHGSLACLEKDGNQFPPDSEFRTLPGDKTVRDRIDELLNDAKEGKVPSIMLLGNADSDKTYIIESLNKLKSGITDSFRMTVMLSSLIRLGDKSSQLELMKYFDSRVYAEQEYAFDALANINNDWAINLLIQTLDDSSFVNVFNDKDMINPEDNIRSYKRYRSLDRLMQIRPCPNIEVNEDKYSDVEIKIYK